MAEDPIQANEDDLAASPRARRRGELRCATVDDATRHAHEASAYLRALLRETAALRSHRALDLVAGAIVGVRLLDGAWVSVVLRNGTGRLRRR